MVRPKTFYSVVAPMFYFVKILGLTPFYINSKKCSKSNWSLFYSLIFAIFINVYAISGIDTSSTITVGLIAEVTNVLDVYLGQTGMCFGILFGCVNFNKIVQLLCKLQDFDRSMEIYFKIDLKKQYRSAKIYSCIALFFTILMVTLSIAYTTIGSTDLFTVNLFGIYISYIAPITINTFVDLQLCTLILCLRQRFRWLNEKVLWLTENFESNLKECDEGKYKRPITHLVASGFVQDKALYFVEKLRKKHYELCTISKMLNKSYSVQILLIILQNFMTITVALYYSGKYIFIDHDISIEYGIYSCAQILLSVTQVCTLVFSCSSTMSEAYETGILIHKITALNNNSKCAFKNELKMEIIFFLLQLRHHFVEFTACGIFVINEALLFSMVGAITTYLVIVIQFAVSDAARLI